MTEPGVVEVTVYIAARPETVFPYFTDPVRYVQWMGGHAVLDPAPGGIYQVGMRDGVQAAGEFVEVEPPRRLVFTWGWTHEHAVAPGSTTVVVTFEDEDGGTRVVLRHYGLPTGEQERSSPRRMVALPRPAGPPRRGRRPGAGSQHLIRPPAAPRHPGPRGRRSRPATPASRARTMILSRAHGSGPPQVDPREDRDPIPPRSLARALGSSPVPGPVGLTDVVAARRRPGGTGHDEAGGRRAGAVGSATAGPSVRPSTPPCRRAVWPVRRPAGGCPSAPRCGPRPPWPRAGSAAATPGRPPPVARAPIRGPRRPRCRRMRVGSLGRARSSSAFCAGALDLALTRGRRRRRRPAGWSVPCRGAKVPLAPPAPRDQPPPHRPSMRSRSGRDTASGPRSIARVRPPTGIDGWRKDASRA